MMLARASFCCEGFRIFGWVDDAAGAGGGALAPSMRQLHRCTASWPPALWQQSTCGRVPASRPAGRQQPMRHTLRARSEIGLLRRRQRFGAVGERVFHLAGGRSAWSLELIQRAPRPRGMCGWSSVIALMTGDTGSPRIRGRAGPRVTLRNATGKFSSPRKTNFLSADGFLMPAKKDQVALESNPIPLRDRPFAPSTTGRRRKDIGI